MMSQPYRLNIQKYGAELFLQFGDDVEQSLAHLG